MTLASTALGRRLRIAGWFGYAALLAMGQLITLSRMPDASKQLAIDAVTYLAPILLTSVAGALLTLRVAGNERRLWGLMTAASMLLLVSETYLSWYFYRVDWRGPRLPAPFELLQLGAVVALLWALATMTAFGQTPLVSRLRILLDVATVMTIATASAYWWLALPLYRDLPRAGWPAAAVTAFYPVLGAFLILLVGAMALGWQSYRWRRWELVFLGALAFYGAGLLFEPIWYAETLRAPAPAAASVLNDLFGFGFYLLFMAIVYRATALDSLAGAPERWPLPRFRSRWLPAVYPVVLSFALPLLVIGSARTGARPEGAFIIALTTALAAALVVRSWLSSVERVRLRGLAITDPVSGAFNRRYLHERLDAELLGAQTSGGEPALVVFDIDDFRRVNVLRGHAFGDQLLRRVAEQIATQATAVATVYRVGSDEFAVLLGDMSSEEVVGEVERTLARVSAVPVLDSIAITLSAGIAFYPRHGADSEQLLAHALAAQQLARASEREEPVVYDDEIVGALDPVERLARARQRSHRAIVSSLAAAVDARDPSTVHHSENVAELAASLAQVLGLSEDEVRIIDLAARVHDVGKVGLRDDILLKQGPLTEEERRLVEEHPVLGERILAPAYLDEVLPIVRHHHERWDGGGYPDGLRGPQIPVGARLLAVCDAFEAMTARRAYRDALSFSEAVEQINACQGGQFDPEVAATFCRMVTQLGGPIAVHSGASLPESLYEM